MVKFAEKQWKRAFFALLGGVFILGAGLACGLLMWINSLSSALDPDDWPPLGEKHEEASAVFTLVVAHLIWNRMKSCFS
ncbi:hypothetical protein CathTA2_1257 [Caldalkalibacillus thermarum TA2.A1]|uniref:Uncharacterized protein n=1 Tax=Caldalkalibacillus thermarum (strain TA2.A1) TaxID=986075 RepID=F5L644_CALTT|nr:hypothetical protein [Caldalkalibacillus thermarum]EGL83198.1 hypothetical protein CathTA2_1257 [Caldalkalibacillus thermarum TA2.A1]QZT33140.1 hypothetical protein HUR95_12605 [Caldalkalibacillus thermarum TA2.A1]